MFHEKENAPATPKIRPSGDGKAPLGGTHSTTGPNPGRLPRERRRTPHSFLSSSPSSSSSARNHRIQTPQRRAHVPRSDVPHGKKPETGKHDHRGKRRRPLDSETGGKNSLRCLGPMLRKGLKPGSRCLPGHTEARGSKERGHQRCVDAAGKRSCEDWRLRGTARFSTFQSSRESNKKGDVERERERRPKRPNTEPPGASGVKRVLLASESRMRPTWPAILT